MSTSSDLESSDTGRLAFDCPWCGAILGVDSEHLGTSFPCPECGESTKLTEDNTRAGHLADVSADDARSTRTKKAKRKASEWESYGRGISRSTARGAAPFSASPPPTWESTSCARSA